MPLGGAVVPYNEELRASGGERVSRGHDIDLFKDLSINIGYTLKAIKPNM